jgi:hypothetical protein
MPLLLVIAGVLMWWFGIWPLAPAHTYAPEVGYYKGEERVWFVGSAVPSRDDCISTATAVYNQYNREARGRAFSWACRQMQGDRFLARVR